MHVFVLVLHATGSICVRAFLLMGPWMYGCDDCIYAPATQFVFKAWVGGGYGDGGVVKHTEIIYYPVPVQKNIELSAANMYVGTLEIRIKEGFFF